jgi:uncharacterized protein YlzI (FlbEa/FlbD family)
MKTRWLLSLVLLIGVALSACKKVQPTEAPNQPTSAYPSPEEYPAPLSGNPYPGSGPVSTNPNALYPMFTNGDEVPWNQAVAMIKNGEVSKVIQTHSLQVTLTLIDGRTLVTKEAAIDDVIKVIQECGAQCKSIAVATE